MLIWGFYGRTPYTNMLNSSWIYIYIYIYIYNCRGQQPLAQKISHAWEHQSKYIDCQEGHEESDELKAKCYHWRDPM
jgi:hypothetical protein